jgi:hypothetical protein
MVAVQVLTQPEWSEPSVDEPGGLVEVVRPQRRRALPDRATRIRRRRLAVLVVGIVVLAALAGLVKAVVTAGSSQIPAQSGPEPISQDVYVVQPGDTLWSIAARLAPEADPRPIVEELRELNDGVELEVGTRLAVGDL